jgi:hypothetical protein
VDDVPMGGTISSGQSAVYHTVRFSIHGTDRIRLVEVIRDGIIEHSIEPYHEQIEDEWIDRSPLAGKASYYYLRVTQTDGNRAWSSPVWM